MEMDAKEKSERTLTNASLAGIAKGYLVMYLINLQEDSYTMIGSLQQVSAVVDQYQHAQTAMNAVIKKMVRPKYQEDMYVFANLSTLSARLKGRTLITCDYKGMISGWCCAQFMPITYDETGNVQEVVYAVQHIQDRKMESLIYQNALESNAVFAYYFDLTEGILQEDFIPIAKKLIHDFSGLDFPMSFDEFICQAYQQIQARPIDNYDYQLTRKEMLRRYEQGETRFRVQYYSEAYGRYFNDEYLLTENEENGHIIAVAVGTDVTRERQEELDNFKKLEAAYAEAKRANLAKTDFLSRMSHDIRTPINGIVGMTYIMERNLEDHKTSRECLNNIKMLSRQLELLVNDVLEMSRIESGKITLTHERFDLIDKLDQNTPAIRVMAENNDVYLKEVQIDITHRVVVGSPLQVQRVVLNIMSNAVKYNKPGGTVECWLQEKPIDVSHSNYCLVVKDTGIGMSEEFLQQIYEPFTRERKAVESRYSGTGLGMAITKELVDRLGGTIQIESQEGVGTTVAIHIPLEISDTEITVEDTERNSSWLKGKRILIVDDNLLNANVLQFMLEEEQMIAEIAGDGHQAIDLFWQKPEGYYDMILMDVRMPVMDGMETTRKIRSLGRGDAEEIPVIAVSANAFEEDVNQCLQAGMTAHVAKPVRKEILLSKVREYLTKEPKE